METLFKSLERLSWGVVFILGTVAFTVGGCTSGKDNPVPTQDPVRVYKATPTVRQMNEQSSTVNRKKNIEGRPNDPATRTPTERTQRVLPGRQPVKPDTTSTRTRRDSTRRE